jgi:hypothetical protein
MSLILPTAPTRPSSQGAGRLNGTGIIAAMCSVRGGPRYGQP